MEENDTDRVACKALALAVLESAIDDLNTARKQRHKVDEQEILAWIESDDETWVFSFVPLCNWLAFDVNALRKKLRA